MTNDKITADKAKKYEPYKVQLHQEVNEKDLSRPMQFCEIMYDLCNRNPRFTKRTVFSDEVTYCPNDSVKHQNRTYWSKDNPHLVIIGHTQNIGKVSM